MGKSKPQKFFTGTKSGEQKEVRQPEAIEHSRDEQELFQEGNSEINTTLIAELEQHINELQNNIEVEPSTTNIIQQAINMLRKGKSVEEVLETLHKVADNIHSQEEKWEAASLALNSVIGILQGPSEAELAMANEDEQINSSEDVARQAIAQRIDRYIADYSEDMPFVSLAKRIKLGILSGGDVYQLAQEAQKIYEENTTENGHYGALAASILLRLPNISTVKNDEAAAESILTKAEEILGEMRDELKDVIEKKLENLPKNSGGVEKLLNKIFEVLNSDVIRSDFLQPMLNSLNNFLNDYQSIVTEHSAEAKELEQRNIWSRWNTRKKKEDHSAIAEVYSQRIKFLEPLKEPLVELIKEAKHVELLRKD